LLLLQLPQQGGLFLICLPWDDNFYLSGMGGPLPMVGLAVRLQEEWSLTHRIWAGMVRFQALLALY